MDSNASVLISGAGQLGSRHLQGLAKCRIPLRIFVQDPLAQSLSRAEQRWNEAARSATPHEVSFVSTMEGLPPAIDVAIVATTADARPGVVALIEARCAVRYWVMEKVLAQSESALDNLTMRTTGSAGAWVNTPRRMMPWHQQIKTQLGLAHPLTLSVTGGAWGLACNAVHFLDLCAWWTGETLSDIGTERLCPRWFESKRAGFWEVGGTLEGRFSGGSRVMMHSIEGVQAPALEVSDGHRSWRIDETAGQASRSHGVELPGRVLYQSEMTGQLVDSILDGGSCDLPTLRESVHLHRIFIGKLRAHWIGAGHSGATVVPIT